MQTLIQKLWDLLDDMAQTMYKAQGVGLAGPRRSECSDGFVIDVGEGILEFVNQNSGNLRHAGGEGSCLSFPGRMHGGKTKPCQVRAEPHGRMV